MPDVIWASESAQCEKPLRIQNNHCNISGHEQHRGTRTVDPKFGVALAVILGSASFELVTSSSVDGWLSIHTLTIPSGAQTELNNISEGPTHWLKLTLQTLFITIVDKVHHGFPSFPHF